MKKILSILLLLLLSVPALSQTVYTTKTGEKYHKSSCMHLRRSAFSIELEEAVAIGYQPCKVCEPPVTVKKGTINQLKQAANTTQSASNYAVQCSGKTKKGSRCKRNTTNNNGRCYQH